MLLNDLLNMTEKQLRFRAGYEWLPVLDNSAPAKRNLEILIAWTSLGEQDASSLAFIQFAKWYCKDVAEPIELTVTLHVPANASTLRSVFDDFGVEYTTAIDLDERDAVAVAELARALDCDLVISPLGEPLSDVFPDEVGLVGRDVLAAQHAVEIHLKGFDMPWSFETPMKNMPWSNFYVMCERKTFEHLLLEFNASRAAGARVHEVMRSIVFDALPALCFSRDRLEFYRQQERWAQRSGLEHQDFGIEYAAYLNHFYLTYYAAVDQVTALVVHLYKMNVPEQNIGATYNAFRNARRAFPAVDKAFSDEAFRDMYRLPRLIRHRAAHSGPVKPADVYFSDGNFTDEQIDKVAEEHGLLENFQFFKSCNVPSEIADHALSMGREKARRILMGPPRRHGVFLRDGKTGLFYYPHPAADLDNFLVFFNRVLSIVKPWHEAKAPAARGAGKK